MPGQGWRSKEDNTSLVNVILTQTQLRLETGCPQAFLFAHDAETLGHNDELFARDLVFLNCFCEDTLGTAIGVIIRSIPLSHCVVSRPMHSNPAPARGYNDVILTVLRPRSYAAFKIGSACSLLNIIVFMKNLHRYKSNRRLVD